MNIYIQTRSIMKDYQFLGKSPSNSWWMAYKDYTSFEHPTIILEGIGLKGWRLYLSGMSSSRLDKVNTPIRYTLILEDSKPMEDPSLSQMLGLIRTWANAVYDESEKDNLKMTLDRLFTQENIEIYFSSLGSDNIFELPITQQLKQWLGGFSSNINEIDIQTGCYIGSMQKSQLPFLQRCKAILQSTANEEQAALYLNFIESKQELENTKLVEDEHYAHKFMLLVHDEKVVLSKVESKKKPILSPQTIPKQRNRPKKWMCGLVVGGLIVMLIVLLF